MTSLEKNSAEKSSVGSKKQNNQPVDGKKTTDKNISEPPDQVTCMREETRAHLRPVQGQPLGGAAVVAAGLGERRPQGRAGRVVQDLLLRRRDPPLAQDLARPQAAVTAAAALGPLARRPAGEAQTKIAFSQHSLWSEHLERAVQ